MRIFPLTLAAVVLASSGLVQARSLGHVFDMSTRYTDRSLDFTSDTTTSVRDMKVVVQARSDAASFVASAGHIRGAQLEAAFQALRERFPQAQQASDLRLAESILAW